MSRGVGSSILACIDRVISVLDTEYSASRLPTYTILDGGHCEMGQLQDRMMQGHENMACGREDPALTFSSWTITDKRL